MKAVVVEIHSGFAAVLSDDGRITKVKNRNYAIGQVIEMKQELAKKIRFMSSVAAAVAVVFGCGIAAYAYWTPYSYVSLDVNPSIEYSLNRFDRLLEVTGVNEDGEDIVEQLQLDALRNQKIDQAIAITIEQIKEQGYFDGTPQGVVIATSAQDVEKAEQLAEDLKQSVEHITEDEEISVESFPVGLERVQEARELGVTPGKLNLVEKLRDSAANPDQVSLEEWLDKPVKEIMRAIKENRKQSPAEEQEAEEQETPEEEAEEQEENEPDHEDDNAESADASSGQAEAKPDMTEKTASKAADKADKTESKFAHKQEKQADVIQKAEDKAQTKLEQEADKAEQKCGQYEAKQERQDEKKASKAKDKQTKENKSGGKKDKS